MPKFIPLTMLKDTTGIVEFCQECGEPVFVARNGMPEMVIMDAAFFDEYLRYRTEDGRLDIRKEFAAIPEAITIKELKNTGEVSALCDQTNEPVNIIRNGYAVLVIISAEGYKKRHAVSLRPEKLSSRAGRKILCKRFSTKSRMALESRADSGLNPLITESHGGQNGMRAGTA